MVEYVDDCSESKEEVHCHVLCIAHVNEVTSPHGYYPLSCGT